MLLGWIAALCREVGVDACHPFFMLYGIVVGASAVWRCFGGRRGQFKLVNFTGMAQLIADLVAIAVRTWHRLNVFSFRLHIHVSV